MSQRGDGSSGFSFTTFNITWSLMALMGVYLLLGAPEDRNALTPSRKDKG